MVPGLSLQRVLCRSCRLSIRSRQLSKVLLRHSCWSRRKTALCFFSIFWPGWPSSTASHCCRKILISWSVHGLGEGPAGTEGRDECIRRQAYVYINYFRDSSHTVSCQKWPLSVCKRLGTMLESQGSRVYLALHTKSYTHWEFNSVFSYRTRK